MNGREQTCSIAIMPCDHAGHMVHYTACGHFTVNPSSQSGPYDLENCEDHSPRMSYSLESCPECWTESDSLAAFAEKNVEIEINITKKMPERLDLTQKQLQEFLGKRKLTSPPASMTIKNLPRRHPQKLRQYPRSQTIASAATPPYNMRAATILFRPYIVQKAVQMSVYISTAASTVCQEPAKTAPFILDARVPTRKTSVTPA